MSENISESKRIIKFRLNIAKDIPKFPNNKETTERLKNDSLNSLMIHYINWAIRYVAIRPRKVHIEPTATQDSRWTTLKSKISKFLEKVRQGEDLAPHMSLDAHTKGYTPRSSDDSESTDRWADKDFLLNVMGYHHFHLGLSIEPKGFASRTNELFIARVTRDNFTVLGIFDHSVFESKQTSNNTMSEERRRLWELFDEHSSRGIPPGSVYVPSMITLSGHSFQMIQLADNYSYIVREIDSQLDDDKYVKEMFQGSGVPYPKKPKLSWNLNVLDLGILDSSSNTFFILRYGPN